MLKQLWAAMKKPRRLRCPTRHDLQHLQHNLHNVYLALVSLETDHWYGKAALAGFVVSMIVLLVPAGTAVESVAEEL